MTEMRTPCVCSSFGVVLIGSLGMTETCCYGAEKNDQSAYERQQWQAAIMRSDKDILVQITDDRDDDA